MHHLKKKTWTLLSALMLAAARIRHIAGTRWGDKRYLNMEHLKAQEIEEETEAAMAG
jgi:hypothetical protein